MSSRPVPNRRPPTLLSAPWASAGMARSLGLLRRPTDRTGQAPGSDGEAAAGTSVLGTRKLRRDLVLCGLALFLGFLGGRVELVILAIPLLVAMTWGLASASMPSLRVAVDLDTDRCMEGDTVVLSVAVSFDPAPPVTGRIERPTIVEVGVTIPVGFEAAEGTGRSVITVTPGEPRIFTVRLRAVRWGTYRLGLAALRVQGPGRFLAFEQIVDGRRAVRVYPEFERLRRGIPPPDTQVYSGEYVARVAGEGIEFAEIRPFVPGDRIRRVNWRITTRRGQLSVNHFHPERNADVVFFLDTFADVGPAGRSSLELAVRGTAVLARHYLEHKDRVGLVSFGGILHWLRATMGQRQVQRIVDDLLSVDVELSYAWKDIDYLPRGTLPPLALVVAFSPLEDERAVRALVNLRARGFPLVVVDTLVEDLVAPLETPPGMVAYRAWKLQREGLRSQLAALGIPVVRWSGRESLEAALAAVPRFRRRGRVRVS